MRLRLEAESGAEAKPNLGLRIIWSESVSGIVRTRVRLRGRLGAIIRGRGEAEAEAEAEVEPRSRLGGLGLTERMRASESGRARRRTLGGLPLRLALSL